MERDHAEAMKVWNSLGQSLIGDPPVGTIGHLQPSPAEGQEAEDEEGGTEVTPMEEDMAEVMADPVR